MKLDLDPRLLEEVGDLDSNKLLHEFFHYSFANPINYQLDHQPFLVLKLGYFYVLLVIALG